MDVLNAEFAGNPLWAWAAFLGTSILAFLILLLARRRLARIWDAIAKTRITFLFLICLWGGAFFLRIPEEWQRFIHTVAIVALLIQGALWANAFLFAWLNRYRDERSQIDPESVSSVGILAFLGQVCIWSVALLLILDNLGVDITALVAGLGIGGIAIALALQSILADLFASLSIVLDKPFVVGDFIIVGDLLGTVERIGIKTTRVRSLSGEQLVFANADLLQSRIRNFKRMYERRVVFSIGIPHQTGVEKVEKVPTVLREAVEAQSQIRFDRAHFSKVGPSSFEFEVVYYVKSPDYNLYMDIQQSINIVIVKRFRELGLEFAYPTQTLHIAGGVQ